MTIELVIETHFHADFLSGHLELAKAIGAKIVYSSVAETEFESMGVQDGERYSLGDVTLEFRARVTDDTAPSSAPDRRDG